MTDLFLSQIFIRCSNLGDMYTNGLLTSPIYLGADNRGFCVTSRQSPISLHYDNAGDLVVYVDNTSVGRLVFK